MESLGLILAFAYTICWAAAGAMLRSLSKRLDPFLIIGVRALIACVIVIPAGLLVGRDQYAALTWNKLVPLVGSVLLGGLLGSTCNVYALRAIGLSRAFPISNSSPLFTLLFSFLILGERPAWTVLPGAILVLIGVTLIARPREHTVHDQSQAASSKDMVVGVGFAVLAAALYGVTGVVLSMGVTGVHALVAGSVRVPAVAITGLAISGVRGEWSSLRGLDRKTIGLLILVGTFGYALVTTFYVAAVQAVGASITSIIGTTTPMFALPFSVLVLHERVTRDTILGTLLTVAGIVLVIL